MQLYIWKKQVFQKDFCPYGKQNQATKGFNAGLEKVAEAFSDIKACVRKSKSYQPNDYYGYGKWTSQKEREGNTHSKCIYAGGKSKNDIAGALLAPCLCSTLIPE